jgi:transposase-like protein
MHTIDVSRKFATEESCTEYLEAMRWATNDDMACRGCGLVGKENFRSFTTKETTRQRFSKKQGGMVTVRVPGRRLHECKTCGRQMNVKNDTVFGFTHLPLDKWFAAVALMLEAKKGMSAMQVCRHLGIDPKVNYKPIWYLCHRIREAMIEAGILTGVVGSGRNLHDPEKAAQGQAVRQERQARCGNRLGGARRQAQARSGI